MRRLRRRKRKSRYLRKKIKIRRARALKRMLPKKLMRIVQPVS